jgi:hypothetical protein
VAASDSVLAEDVPAGASRLLPGIAHLTQISIEPLGAPATAHKLLARTATRIAKAAHGVIIDPQTDTLEAPSGVKRYRPRKRGERFDLLVLSWWSVHELLFSRAWFDQFTGCLESLLPEALPRRYGLYEPPQHLYCETGREHFLTLLDTHKDTVVWYPHRPVLSVGVHSRWSGARNLKGFRAHYVSVGIEAAVMAQPGWSEGLHRFWRAASGIIRPFYGDVRTLQGFIPAGATYAVDSKTDRHPIRAGWWAGIPPSLGHAAVLGEPYIPLWPAFTEAAEKWGNLFFLATPDWRAEHDVSHRIGTTPRAIRLRSPGWVMRLGGAKLANYRLKYPSSFPFRDPHSG